MHFLCSSSELHFSSSPLCLHLTYITVSLCSTLSLLPRVSHWLPGLSSGVINSVTFVCLLVTRLSLPSPLPCQCIVLVRETTVPAWVVSLCSPSFVEQPSSSFSLAVSLGFCEGPVGSLLPAVLQCTGAAWPELKWGSWSHGQRGWL